MAVAVYTSFGQEHDASGDPLNGGTITVHAAGTSTLLSLFTDTALSVAASNPITLDSAGRHDVRYFSAAAYKVTVKNSAGVTIYARDNIDPGIPIGSGALAIANGGTSATTAGAALTALGGATAAELADVAADVAALSGTLASSEKTHIATGTTAQRVAAPVAGDIRYNTDNTLPEVYNGSNWDAFAVTASDTDTSASDTQEGLIEIATQAEMETATDTVRAVVPGRAHHHPGAAKGWAQFDASGTIASSYNVTSITDGATGFADVNWATDFANTNYAVVASAKSAAKEYICIRDASFAAGVTSLRTTNDAGTDTAPTAFMIVAYGDHA